MSETVAAAIAATGCTRLDMTGQPSQLRYVEIVTDAGIIRVNTGLVNTRDGRQVVCVEIEPGRNGEWDTEVRDHFTRTDVTLTRRVLGTEDEEG